MISVQDAIDQFKAILGAASSWALLAKSQFVEHMAIFSSWALRDALWKVERATQEFFLSTALNDSSIMSHAEDREYVPRKATPSRGTVRITNGGIASVILPSNSSMVSEAQVPYLFENSVTIAPGGYVDAETAQLSYAEPIIITVDAATPFFEVLFPTGSLISRFQVSVNLGAGFVAWTYARLFQNSRFDALVYDEFFNHKGETGVRFGNGIFGLIPPSGAKIKVEYWVTQGATNLITGQQLRLVADALDLEGNPATLAIVAQEAIDGGGAPETIDEMRKNLHYWPRYNYKLVWDDDYAFFIKSRISGIAWFKCWGEEAQEDETGADVQNINKIFITGYAPGNANLSVEALAELQSVSLLNRKFQWVAPLMSNFTVAVVGKVSRGADIPTALAGIKTALALNYGADSFSRRADVEMSDIYSIIKATEFFDSQGASFRVTVAGITAPTLLREMVSLDITSSTFDLTYS